ncbi:hypothetical protein LZ496_02380 [Sphingomonas sp. NSE70-1]|uniref:Sulfotransferase family protein n=1 Tax=Sphingomonas caseinilyticus TaxID=2908205 RepID=A0ABT0RRJ0_9SPHN|nr:hypothetical protein [Sphingomonas caseinilyticus]MCL6697632.1 hypothetical protein [Sphingomonas caseinilyticus]
MAEPLDPAEIFADAHWLAQAYDPASDMVRFVAMEPSDYREASFLDDRMFDRWRDVRVMPLPEVRDAAASITRQDASWIFHIGHVGSTLLARMLGEVESALSIREPRILRDLAFLEPDRRDAMVPVVRKLCSRSFADSQQILVKATSFVSEIAPLLIASEGRALFMSAGARSYIETILAGENSVRELHALHEYRSRRMEGRLESLEGATSSDAHRAAMAWACEMTALEAAVDAMPDRTVLWLDFDRFLAAPVEGLTKATAHLGISLSADEAGRIVEGPLMRRYSKGLEHDYSPELRLELQIEARQRHGAAIEAALRMLNEASSTAPLLARALGRDAGRH